MKKSELEILMTRLEGLLNEALGQAFPEIIKIKSVLSEIYKLSTNDRKFFEKFHQELGEKLFEKDIKLKEFNPDAFKIAQSAPPITVTAIIDDFDSKFKELIKCVGEEFNHLRRFAILKFGNVGQKTSVVLLHDSFSKNSILNSVNDYFDEDCELINYKDFLTQFKSDNSKLEKLYLAMLVFSPSATDEDVSKFLEDLRGYFPVIEKLSLIQTSDLDKNYYVSTDNFEEIKTEIKYLIEIDVINKQINPFEEKILKKMFSQDYCHTLEYRLVSSGFSGAKVIEVTPFKLFGKSAKFVVKIDETTKEERKEKIKGELENFKKFIKTFDNAYSIEDEKTETHIAIKYNFASSDGKIGSDSFSTLYKQLDPKGTITFDPERAINNLFDINLFKNNWDSKTLKIERRSTFEQLYSAYINLEKIVDAISKITNTSVEDIRKSNLILNFQKIFSHKMSLRTKICHGDLHTENFFIDETGSVFLIDFGDTNIHHAVIDFTTLECSIKFRHIPFFIDSQLLIEIEEELLAPESFDPTFVFTSIRRNDLIMPFRLIQTIRQLSNPFIYDSKNKLDYLISLFILTFRQIRYDGLNQLYALKVAEKLGNRIVSLI